MAELRYLSVCSGIEAASVAWNPLGWKAVAFSEIEPFPNAVLQHHYPDVPNWGDMTKFKEWPDADVDVLAGGTPCQSFSVAGLRKGLDDPRGNLMLTYLAIAERYRPKYCVWENVPGVLSAVSHNAPDPCPPPPPMDLECDGQEVDTEDEYDSEELHALNCFLAGLSELGYGWAMRVLDAQWFGVPQRRRRVFVVGHSGGDWHRPFAVLFNAESLSGNPPPSRKARKDVAPTIGARTSAGGGLGTDFDCDGGLIARSQTASNQRIDGESENFVIGTLAASGAGSARPAGNANETDMLVTHALTADGFDASEDGSGRGTPLVTAFAGMAQAGWAPPSCPTSEECALPLDATRAQAVAINARQEPVHGDIAGPINTGHPQDQAVCFRTDQEPEVNGDGSIAPTLCGSQFSTGGGQQHAVMHPAEAVQVQWASGGGQVENDTAQALRSGAEHSYQFLPQELVVRRLTPVECEYLQGFEKNYTRIPIRHYKRKPKGKRILTHPDYFEENPDGTWTKYSEDGSRYKALGNSWAVPVPRWIGERIQMVEDLCDK